MFGLRDSVAGGRMMRVCLRWDAVEDGARTGVYILIVDLDLAMDWFGGLGFRGGAWLPGPLPLPVPAASPTSTRQHH